MATTQTRPPIPAVARLGFTGVFFKPDMDFATKLRILSAKAKREHAAILVNQEDAASVIAALAAALEGAGLGDRAAEEVKRWNASVDLLEANVGLPGQMLNPAQRLPARGAGASEAAPAAKGSAPFNFA